MSSLASYYRKENRSGRGYPRRAKLSQEPSACTPWSRTVGRATPAHKNLRRKLGHCTLNQDWGLVIGENREWLVGRQYAESSLRCHCEGQHLPSRSSQSLDRRASCSFLQQSQAQGVLSCRRDLSPPLGRGCRGP